MKKNFGDEVYLKMALFDTENNYLDYSLNITDKLNQLYQLQNIYVPTFFTILIIICNYYGI